MIELQLDATTVECRAFVTGVVAWSPLTVVPKSVTVELRYQTSGRGPSERNRATYGTIEPSMEGRHPFRLLVPSAGPVSYEGNLIKVEWLVQVTIKMPKGRDLVAKQKLTVIPRRAGFEPIEPGGTTEGGLAGREILPPYEPPT